MLVSALITASHFFAFSAGMITSKPVVLISAFAPSSFATALAMSTSAPTALPPWRNSIGGYVVSLQKVIVLAF